MCIRIMFSSSAMIGRALIAPRLVNWRWEERGVSRVNRRAGYSKAECPSALFAPTPSTLSSHTPHIFILQGKTQLRDREYVRDGTKYTRGCK